MGKVLKVHSIKSDGTEVPADSTFEYVLTDANNKPYLGDDGKPSVVFTLCPISHAEWRTVVRNHTDVIPAKKGNPPREETDWDGVNDELVLKAVKNWRGVIGADDKPLDCIADTKLGLPGDIKNDLIQRALQGEAVESASFRPAS
jgi:hypothetical protein